MTTSSSERSRCNQLSPSAVLDSRVQGEELEWALDHLKRCDACRNQVEDLREMLLRVERLPTAPLSAAVLADAYAQAIPVNLRSAEPAFGRLPEPPAPREEVPAPTFVDVISQPPRAMPRKLRDIRPEFKPGAFPAPASTAGPSLPKPASRAEAIPPALPPPVTKPFHVAAPIAPAATDPPDIAKVLSQPDPEPELPLVASTAPMALPARGVLVDSPRDPVVRPEALAPLREKADVHDGAPASEPAESPARQIDLTRLAVGFVAAACVLLAGVLYGSDSIGRVLDLKVTTSASPTTLTTGVSLRPSVGPSLSPTPSALPSPSPPAAPVVATVGNGVSGESVYRIRPGTAVASFTRLVFDLTGQGLPTMIVTRPDALHLVVTFKDTGGVGVPVQGLQSFHLAGVEPAVQQGADLIIAIDLARPVRPVAFTLAPEPGKSPRLVLDLYTN